MDDATLTQRFLAGAHLITDPICVCSAAEAGVRNETQRMFRTETAQAKRFYSFNLPDGLVRLHFVAQDVPRHCTIVVVCGATTLLAAPPGSCELEASGFIVPNLGLHVFYVAVHNRHGDDVEVSGTLATEWVDLTDEQYCMFRRFDYGTVCTLFGGEWLACKLGFIMPLDMMLDAHMRTTHTVVAHETCRRDPNWKSLLIEHEDADDIARMLLIDFPGLVEVRPSGWQGAWVNVSGNLSVANVRSHVVQQWPGARVKCKGTAHRYVRPTVAEQEAAARATLARYHELVTVLGPDLVVVE